MKRTLTFGALASLVLASALASAQTETVKPLGVALRGGFFLPTNGDARDAGKSWVGFGFEYKLVDLETKSNSGYKAGIGISVDYYGKGDYSNVPVLLNYLGKKDEIFYSAGVGVGFGRTPSENKSMFTYQVGVGYEFNKSSSTPFFIEGKFFGSQRPELNGFGIYFGVRI